MWEKREDLKKRDESRTQVGEEMGVSVSGVDEFETLEGQERSRRERWGYDFAVSYKYSFLLADESGSSKLALQAVSRVKSANERPLCELRGTKRVEKE